MWDDSQLHVKNIIFTNNCELIVRWRMQLMNGDDYCTAVLDVSKMLTRMISYTFSLSFYTKFFSPSPLNPCGYSTFLIMMQNVPFSPNLHDLRLKWKLAFLSAGWRCWGWVYKNQIEYQMANPCGYCTCLIMMKHVSFSPSLYTTAWHILRNDLHDLRLTCKPFLLQLDVAGDGSTKTNIKMNTKWLTLAAILPAW